MIGCLGARSPNVNLQSRGSTFGSSRKHSGVLWPTLGSSSPARPECTRPFPPGGGPDHSEPRRQQRRRGSRGCGDGGRGEATGLARFGVTVVAAAAVAATTRLVSRAEHGDSLCPRPPRLAQLEEPPASGADGPPREGVSNLAPPYGLRGDAAAE